MILNSHVIATCALALSLGSAALAQTSEIDSTQTKAAVLTGVVQTVSDHTLTIKDQSGLHSYSVPDGFRFRMGKEEIGIDQLKPGMPITADITDELTMRDVTVTRRMDGTVMQVTPGGLVLLDPRDGYVSYDFQDARGNELHYLTLDGREASLREVKIGDHLKGQLVTRFPPEIIDERIVQLDVASAPGLASAAGAPATSSQASSTSSP